MAASRPPKDARPSQPAGPRVACLLVPLFPLAARLRAEPERAQDAVALIAGPQTAPRVLAASAAARRAGVTAGLSLPQAKALLPRLVARRRDEQAERAAQLALLEAADAFSPLVEDGGPGLAFLDISGAGDEAGLGLALMRRCAAAGLTARVGAAATKTAARVAAQSADGAPVIVPPGGQEKFLAPLPLEALAAPRELAETLEKWGVRAIGELARLPEGGVAARLGVEGWRLQQAARGIDERPLVPRRRPQAFCESLELEWPVCELQAFLAAAREPLSRLCARLEGLGQACRRLELTLALDPRGHEARAWELPSPTRDLKTLLALVALELEARPPRAPVVGVSVLAEPEAPRAIQLSLFGPAAQSPDKLSTALARLCALLGPDRVGTPRSVDTRKPEAYSISAYDPPPAPDGLEPRGSPRAVPFMMIRALRPRVPLQVELENGAPANVKSQGRSLRLQILSDLEIQGRVRAASGPWRLAEAWWSDNAIERSYWDVELEDGAVYRLFFDELARAWFADGIYD